MYVYIYIYIYMCVYIYIYIYIRSICGADSSCFTLSELISAAQIN